MTRVEMQLAQAGIKEKSCDSSYERVQLLLAECSKEKNCRRLVVEDFDLSYLAIDRLKRDGFTVEADETEYCIKW